MSTANILLRRVLEEWDEDEDGSLTRALVADIRTYLAAEPEAESVYQISSGVSDWLDVSEEYFRLFGRGHTRYRILYSRPPKPAEPAARKPSASTAYLADMAPEWRKRHPEYVTAFLAGIRFAEKHHGIGGEA
jgi:hypothetical protein